MTERHPNVLEVLIREIRQDGKADVVLGKSLRVLTETQLLQPISYLLHEAASSDDRVSRATRWLGCGGSARIKPAIRRIYQGAVVPEGAEFYPKEHNPMGVIDQGPRTPGTLDSWSS
jgi:hypothetical protein